MNIFKRIRTKYKRSWKGSNSPRSELLQLMPKHSICAEIGVWKGNFSKRIIDVISPSELHLIDPWKYQTGFGHRLYGGKVARNQEDMDHIHQQVVAELSKYDFVTIHREFSNVTHATFTDEYYDWIYLDGNHYYEFVLQDLQNFGPKIKMNGYLTGDDYLWSSPELHGDRPVYRAVNDFVNSDSGFKFFKIIDDQFILKKCASFG